MDEHAFKIINRGIITYLMRLLISIFLIFFSINSFVSADTWLCGTPLLHQEHPPQHPPEAIAAAPAAPVQIGQTERFFIHIPEAEVTATCIAKSEHLYVYIDNSVRDMLTDAEAAAITREFDTRIYPSVREWMGSEWKPGLDRDNRITLLMHDVGMNNSGEDYGGYFASTDQIPTAPNSNRREMLYMDIFQFKERSRHTFYSSLAHEFAHLINWFQNGGTSDQRWLEEGTASFVEWAVYGTVHTLFVDGYLSNPSISLVYANTWEVYYGAAFMLMLYLYEQHGEKGLIRTLAASDALGEQAINAALASRVTNPSNPNVRFPEVFLNWGLANWTNTQARNRQLGYANLRDRRVNAAVPRVSNYPNRANNLPIDRWSVHYTVFQNLPETLDLSVTGANTGNLYATTLYLTPDGQTVITPIPFDTENRGHIRPEGLQRRGELVLMVTTDTSGTFHYVAAAPPDISDAERAIGPLRQRVSDVIPDAVTFALKNHTQPSYRLTDLTPKKYLEPKTQIHLASDYTDVEIGGIDEDYLYAASHWGLEIFTLIEPTKPTHVGEIATPGQARAVAVDGETAYIADGAAGVHVIDIAVPTDPSITKTIRGFTDASQVHITDEHLYALDRDRGMLAFNLRDVHNVLTPQPRRFFRTAGTPLNVTIYEDTVYFSDDRHGLFILDPSPFGDFVVRSTVPILATAYQIAQVGNASYAYVASGNLTLVDVTDPQNPQTGLRLNTPGFATGIQFQDNIVYLTDQQAGLHIIDARNPQQPQRLSSQPTFGNAKHVALRDTLAYIADGKGGIQTIDISQPKSPKWLHRYAFGDRAYGLDVVKAGVDTRTIYVANGTGGLKTLEFTTPYQGTMTESLSFSTNPRISGDSLEAARCTKIRVRDGYGFAGVETGIFVVDLTANTIVAHVPTDVAVSDIALHGDYVYLCAGSLIVIDSRVPQQSRIVARRDMPGSAYRVALDVDSPTHAYVAALEGGLYIFDITDPATPRPVGSYPTQGNATGVALKGKRVYLLDSGVGVAALDITEPNKPELDGIYRDDTILIDAQVGGDLLYLLDSESVQVIDTRALTTTSAPLYRNRELQFPSELKLVDGVLYITDLYQLRTFRVHPEGYSLAVEELTPSDWKPTPLKPTSINRLNQNFPNPFNPETWIPYQLASDAKVGLHIYDTQGRRIYSQTLGYQKAGSHTAYWDGRNTAGEPVASGVYFYSLEAGSFQATRKMLIQR